MIQTRSFLRRAFDSIVAARTREANRRVAMYNATFTTEDIWEDLAQGRNERPAERRMPSAAMPAAR